MSFKTLGLILIAALLTGCASMLPQRTFDAESELLAKRGAPSRVWDNEDGTRTLEYATQPYGTECWMYTVDADGVIVEQLDALARSNLARVKAGMTVEEVQRLLGQHRSVQRFSLSNEEVYDWNISNEWPDLVATRFNVHFVEGEVVRTSQSFVYPQRWPFGLSIGVGSHPYWGMGFGWPHYHPWHHPYYPYPW